jgi:hypothetical protein
MDHFFRDLQRVGGTDDEVQAFFQAWDGHLLESE